MELWQVLINRMFCRLWNSVNSAVAHILKFLA